ncbi:hypothetical protein Poly51_04120 [Rubripirellula tenax]|uniref:Uncharacterized protein n=1 Tax=Rubripirellula tenax TaxID=2528015 RepID=A0A5C6FFE6_9BACT|nr:hypothetical protein [Rubripirellula tenax]TWU60138.1 hypothetical protein Poly51_04120 [Rubripirellula tenax]
MSNSNSNSNNNSSSPFELFRRNLKPFMIFATLLALVSFVILPILQTYLQKRAGAGSDAVVAKFGGTDLTQTRVSYFTQNHAATVQFLSELANETISRGGVPRTSGFDYDAQSQQIRSLGINESPNDDGTIRTFMFAEEARKAGFELDDNALQVWLERFTDGLISPSEITARLMQATGNRMGPPHLYEQLRSHMLADVYLRRGNSGLFGNQGPLLTPDEQWKNFLKLNQNATINAYGLLVNDFIEKTDANPPEARVREVYDDGKDRDANDQSPEPGFHKRYNAKFEYLVGNYQTYLDEEVAKLSDEAVRAEYDRRLKGGDFQLPEEEAADEPAAADESAADAAETDDDMKDEAADEKAVVESDSGDAEKSEPEMKDEPAEEESEVAEESENEAEPASEPIEKAAEVKEKLEAQRDELKKDLEDVKKKVEDVKKLNEDAAKPAEADSSGIEFGNGARLVFFQDEDTEAESDEEEPAKKDVEKKAEPADEANADEPKKKDVAEKGEPKKEEAKKEEPKKEEPKKDDTPKVQTFEDVREDIARDLAGPLARDRMDKAVTAANTAMRTYFSRQGIYKSNLVSGKKVDPPAKPDLAKLAQEYGLTLEVIGPHSEATIGDEPIANSFEVGTQFGRRGPSFGIMMFGFDNGQTQLAKQPLFSPVRTADDQAGKMYVTWKTEETEAYTPSLDEVRDEVVLAIRTQEARKLATEAAAELVKQADAGKSLAELVPDEKKANFYEGLGPFTWMESFGFQGATIGNVPELDSVGEKFMSAVFTTDEGGYSAGANQPGRVIYIVQPSKFEPSTDELRRQFKQPVNRMMARMVASDLGEIRRGYYEQLDKTAGFEEIKPTDE